MNQRLRKIALVAALACAGNLLYAGFNGVTAAEQYGCGKGCDRSSQCGSECGCFPNPFDKLPEPGVCTN